MVEQILAYIDNGDNDADIREEQDNIFNVPENTELSFHHKVHAILQDIDYNDMPTLLNQMDSGSMSTNARKLAQFHKEIILLMRQELIDENLIMRASYNGYTFHKYPASDFQRKSFEYIKQSDTYKFIEQINEKNPNVSQKCLLNTVEQVECTLKDLLSSKLITTRQYIHMHLNRSYAQLNYLHFVPDIVQGEMLVRPIIICKDGATMNITRYLSHLLWSIFNRVYGCKTFFNGADAVHALEQYVKNGHLQSITFLATFNINNICTRFPHDETIKALENILNIHGSQLQDEVGECLSNVVILQLIHLVLDNQFFVYQNKLYQQIKGSASGSLLTIPLACIYMFHCQSTFEMALINNKNNELFGRYRDNLFLTWNGSKDELSTLLNISDNKQHEHIQINPFIGKKVHFHNVELSHNNGILHTKIYRDPTTDEYEVPNKFQYGTNKESKLIEAALIYAIRCSSIEADFHDEIRHIRKCYLSCDFSTEFVRQNMIEFFQKFDIGKICNGKVTVPYNDLRQRVLEYYQEQLTLKKQRQIEKQNILHILYPSHWNSQMVTDIKNNLQEVIKHCVGDNEAQSSMNKIEIVARPNSPISMNDYLIDKKPSCHLLTLSANDKTKECM
ncbi:unnamed protein product [Adineta steineri]|uniref:Reverse transcriptase domain-containing protein n=2 Tax=Adineta steineri TaxID=433720 RepID=A0A815FAS9_9BILA|nr:unnamed protein product [Adineta steineri]